MSAWSEARAAPAAVRDVRAEQRLAPLWVRLAIFFAGTTMAALAYVHVLQDAPSGTAVAVAAVATAYGAALSLTLAAVGGARFTRRSARVARTARAAVVVVVTLLALELGLLAVGVPVHLIAPWHWGALERAVDGGLGQLGSWVWPYTGSARWARLSVLMLLVPTTTLMALLFFWPGREGAGARRLGALAIAVALALCGMSNTHGGGWREQGLLLVVLVFAWLWLPTLGSSERGRALGWTLACAVAALVAAPLLGASHGWISFETGLEGRTVSAQGARPVAAANDFTGPQGMMFGPIEKARSQESLLAVQARQPPGLLRITSLDRFDGLRFIRSDAPPETSATDIVAGAQASWHESATVTVGALRSNLLAGTSGITTRVGWSDNRAPSMRRAPDGTLSLASPPAAGASYSVLSYTPKPTTAQLREAPSTVPGSYLPYTEFELPAASASALAAAQLAREAASPPRNAQLVRAPALATAGAFAGSGAAGAGAGPAVARRILASPYGPMYTLARHLAAGAGSSYEVVARVERYLLKGFTYDEQPPLVRYPLEAFLFASKHGYCEQFSGAMALMLRMDGIPARVGVGFKPTFTGASGTTSAARSSGGLVWTALPQDAHAWVEVFFSGIGWVPFDPTPATGAAGGRAGSAAFGRLAQETLSANSGSHAHISPVTVPVTRAHGAGGGGGSFRVAAWQWALIVIALVSSLLAWLYLRSARARARDRGGAVSGAAAEGAVRELERALRGLAWPLLPGMTLAQIAQRLERVGQPQAAAYVKRLRDRRFAGAPALAAPELSAARAERVALRRALARGKGLRGRLRALRLLPPGAPSL